MLLWSISLLGQPAEKRTYSNSPLTDPITVRRNLVALTQTLTNKLGQNPTGILPIDCLAETDAETGFQIDGHDIRLLRFIEEAGMKYDVRRQLKDQVKHLDSDHGLEVSIGFELEFTLSPCQAQLAYDAASRLPFDDMLQAIERNLIENGISIASSNFEQGTGQFEFSFSPAEPLRACDQIIFSRYAIKHYAQKFGVTASFLPQPANGVPANALHTNISFANTNRTNNNLTLRQLAISIQSINDALAFLAAPTINSYRRLSTGQFGAPTTNTFDSADKRACMRLMDDYLEYRLPDSATNPYLMCSALLFCLKTAHQDGKGNVPAIPADLQRSTRAFRDHSDLIQFIGPDISQVLCELKEREWQDFLSTVSSFDHDSYFYL